MRTLRPHRDRLDEVLAIAQAGDVVELDAEVYPTKGCWAAGPERAFLNVPAGVRIVGAGMDRTVIQLSKDAVKEDGVNPGNRPDRDLHTLWCGDGAELCGLTVDCNEGAHRAYDTWPAWYCDGIRKHGNLRLEEVRVVHMRGTWADITTLNKEIEAFALSGRGDVTRSAVRRCRVEDCADNAYVSGLMLGGATEGFGRGLVADCVVDIGRGNQFAFSANDSVTFRGCYGRGAKAGFYNDTGSARGIELLDCHLDGAWAGIDLIGHDPKAARSLVVRGGTIRAPRLIEIIQRPGGGVPVDVLIAGTAFDGVYVAAVDNPAPCTVRIQDCILPDSAVVFATKRSPLPITRANFRPDGTGHPNALRSVIQ